MTFLYPFEDGRVVINGLRKIGKDMYARKVAPGKILNPAKNGAIFVRRVKPVGKVLSWFKGIRVPPTAVVVVGGVIVVAGIGYSVYKVVQWTRSK